MGERRGREYMFVSRTVFEEMIADGRLAEWAEVHGEYYGTPAENLEGLSGDGPVPVLDIDVAGRRPGHEARDGPPWLSSSSLPARRSGSGRLAGRGTESPRAIARRLETGARRAARGSVIRTILS